MIVCALEVLPLIEDTDNIVLITIGFFLAQACSSLGIWSKLR